LGGDAVDGVALVALLLFAAWGAFHGIVRPLLGLAVLAVGVVLASALSPRIEGPLTKVATLTPEGLSGAAWLTVWVGTVVVGGVVLHLLRRPLDAAPKGGFFGRSVGALVGVVQGVLVLGLVVYGVLGSYAPSAGPGLVVSLGGSRLARLEVDVHERVQGALRLPPGVKARVALVDARVAAGWPP